MDLKIWRHAAVERGVAAGKKQEKCVAAQLRELRPRDATVLTDSIRRVVGNGVNEVVAVGHPLTLVGRRSEITGA